MGYCKKHDAYNGNGHCPHCGSEFNRDNSATIDKLIRQRDEALAELAHYRRDNEKLTNALAWELKESGNAMDARRYRWLRTFATWVNEDYESIHYRWNAGEFESVDAAVDAAMEGK